MINIGAIKQLMSNRIQPFEERGRTWYRALQKREQRLIIAAAIVLPLMILLFVVILPLQDHQQQLKDENTLLQQKAIDAEKLADYLVSHQMGKVRGRLNAMALVEQLARDAQVRRFMTRIRPQPVVTGAGQRLMLQMKDVPYSASIEFVSRLAAKGLTIISVRMQQGRISGEINLQMVLDG